MTLLLPVKKRHLLTRRNHLRLRYVALPTLWLLLFAAMISFSEDSKAVYINDYVLAELEQPAQKTEDKAAIIRNGLEERYRTSQKRMQRYDAGNQETPAILQENITLVSLEIPSAPQPKKKTLKIGKGDTLSGVLKKAGIDESDAYKAVKALKKHYNPRNIRPGQELSVRLDPVGNDDGYEFSSLKMAIDPLKTVRLHRDNDGTIKASLEEKKTVRRLYPGKAAIEVSLYGSGIKAGIPTAVLAESIRIFSWDVDFQRDIRRGDILEVMYEQFETEDGTYTKSGDIIYARLDVNGQNTPVYRYEDNNGDVDYYTADGISVRKALMKTPIDGARISSGYGARKHPVLGYTKIHKGIDFAASRGTPIYAAGDGTIERFGKWSSFGNYIRIRHNSTLKTAYAHMKGFAKGLHAGKRVKQGQVIGYVGTTGRSTGPHLHYEVLLKGRQTNPKTIKLPQGETLRGEKLKTFQAHAKAIDRQYKDLTASLEYAAADTDKNDNTALH